MCFPQTFPLVAQLADKEDAVCREILSAAAQSLVELAVSLPSELGWNDREILMAKAGGVYGRSKYLRCRQSMRNSQKSCLVRGLAPMKISPAEAAVQMAIRGVGCKPEMPPEADTSVERARTASTDELKSFVHASGEDVLLALLENPHSRETHVTLLLERLDLPVERAQLRLPRRRNGCSSEGVRLRLACHPRTPKRIALGHGEAALFVRLVRLTLLPSAPADIKRVAEEIILARLPQLPVGQKLTLARRGPRVSPVRFSERAMPRP